ncbi:hypothetical protein D3C84_889880 [compost metagenome]
MLHPLVQAAVADAGLGAEHGRQFGDVEEAVAQAMVEVVFEGAAEHALVEGGVEGQQRAVAEELHEAQQGFRRLHTGGQFARGYAMDQHAGAEFAGVALQGAFELAAEVDGAIVDADRADGQHQVAAHVQAAGFQVEDYEALVAQGTLIQGLGSGQVVAAGGEARVYGRAAGEPGECVHS